MAGLLDGLINILLSFFAKIFFWVLNGIVAAIDEQLAPIANAIPALDNEYGSVLYQYFNLVNYFVPLSWILTLLTAYFVIVLGVLLVQWITKFIPTL